MVKIVTEHLEESKAIMDALRRIVQALRHSSTQCEEYAGLTSAQFFVLKQIKSQNGLSVNELATLTYTHQSTVSEVLGKLETRGFIIRGKSEDDGRRVEIYITKEGKKRLNSGFMTVQENLMRSIGSLSPNKVLQLAQLLNELIHKAGLSDQDADLFFEDMQKKDN